MKVRGEYIRADGKVIPNQFTQAGMELLLKAAFWRDQTVSDWLMGLCMQIPQDNISVNDLNEPTIGLAGYGRQTLTWVQTDWPVIGSVANETFVESASKTFPLTGALSGPVTRLFLIAGNTVVSISSPINDSPQIYSSPQTFKYRLYFR